MFDAAQKMRVVAPRIRLTEADSKPPYAAVVTEMRGSQYRTMVVSDKEKAWVNMSGEN